MKKKNKHKGVGKWMFLWIILIIALFGNWFSEFLGKQANFEIVIHSVIFLVGVGFIFLALKLKNKKAKKYIVVGAGLIFLVELIKILFHSVFAMRLSIVEYLSYGLIIQGIGALIVMKGFKEISK